MSRSQYQKIFISRDNKIHSIEPGGRQNRSVFGIAKLLNSLFHLVRWRFRHYQRTFHCPANKKRQIKLFHPDPQTQTWALYKKRIRMVKFSSSGQKKRRFRNHQRPAKDIIRFRGGGATRISQPVVRIPYRWWDYAALVKRFHCFASRSRADLYFVMNCSRAFLTSSSVACSIGGCP